MNALGYDARIILTDAEPDKEAIKKYSGNYTFVKAEDDLKDKNRLCHIAIALIAVSRCLKRITFYLPAGGQRIVVRMRM